MRSKPMGHHLKGKEDLEKRRSMKSLSYWLWWARWSMNCVKSKANQMRSGEWATRRSSLKRKSRNDVTSAFKGEKDRRNLLSHPKKKWRPNGSQADGTRYRIVFICPRCASSSTFCGSFDHSLRELQIHSIQMTIFFHDPGNTRKVFSKRA